MSRSKRDVFTLCVCGCDYNHVCVCGDVIEGVGLVG